MLFLMLALIMAGAGLGLFSPTSAEAACNTYCCPDHSVCVTCCVGHSCDLNCPAPIE
jgi:hypothetical protein